MKSFLSLNDIASRDELNKLYRRASEYRRMGQTAIHTFFQGITLGSTFRYNDGISKPSIETAMWRLGGRVVSDDSIPMHGVVTYDESYQDYLNRMSCFCDIIAYSANDKSDNTMRIKSVTFVSEKCQKPLINCGTFTTGNPLQSLTDLYTIWDHQQGNLDNLKIVTLGDPNSPVYKSFKEIIERFCPGAQFLREANVADSYPGPPTSRASWKAFDETISECDILYMTRYYREFYRQDYYPSARRCFRKLDLSRLKETAILVHPMISTGELDVTESNPQVKTWKNVTNGIFVRMALLESLLI